VGKGAEIVPYRGLTTGLAPAAVDLIVGEIASNAVDGRLYLKDTGNVVRKVADRIHAAALDALFAGADGIVAKTAARTIVGTANRVTVTNGDGVAGNPTVSGPQDIHTGASPTFSGLTLPGTLDMSGGSAVDEWRYGIADPRIMIIGLTRRASTGYWMLGRNLHGDPTGTTDVYKTPYAGTGTGYQGIEMAYDGHLRIYSSNATTTANGTVTPQARLDLDGLGNVVIGTGALATNATDGYLYLPTCAGTPTGTPTAVTGRVPTVVDTSTSPPRVYYYVGGAWRYAPLT
jgi:hypothetical protein